MNLEQLRQDRSVYWVATENDSEKERGTFEEPFTDILKALEILKAGETVVLKEGSYAGNVTFQVSGEKERPLRIIAAPGAKVELVEACWYFYDCSDIIVDGFSFVQSPVSSVLVMGKSERNLFKNLSFLECSNGQDKGCTMFFGGSGIRDNIVENCLFDNNPDNRKKAAAHKNIACMISDRDGDVVHNEVEKTFFRNNTFRNYWRALQIGSYENSGKRSSHLVEGNCILDCAESGICVNSSDTVIQNNLFHGCRGRAAVMICGRRNIFEDNRIEESNSAIMINNPDQTVKNNCIAGYKKSGIYITSAGEEEGDNLIPLFLQNNNFIRGGSKPECESGSIYSESVSPCLIESNIFSDKSGPYFFKHGMQEKQSSGFIKDNRVCDRSYEMPGCTFEQIDFEDMENGNYEQSSDFGAHGWMAVSAKISRTAGGAHDLPEITDASNMKPSEEIIDRVNREDILKAAGFKQEDEG